jgi:hypothetical protein
MPGLSPPALRGKDLRKENRVSREELAALIKRMEALAPLDKADYQIITTIIQKTLTLQQICREGREPSDEEMEELLTVPRPEKAHE